MSSQLPVADSQASVEIGSSVFEWRPIQRGAAASPRSFSLLLSLVLTPLSIYGLAMSLIAPGSLRTANGTLGQTKLSVSLLLQDPYAVQAPVRSLYGSRPPGGEGHREGTGTLDPRLIPYTTRFSQPSDAIDPGDLSEAPKAERVFLSLNPALPLQAGGDGLAAGTGQDSAKGPGGLFGPGGKFDFRLIPIRQVRPHHQLVMGEQPEAKVPVKVLILIGNDGVPFRARAMSGPPFLYADALEAAMQWRFEPLAPHGLKAPIASTLTFLLDLLESE
jgi:hypothetical protein